MSELTPKDWLELYTQMLRMRAVEERANRLFNENKTVGRIYTGRGQEAISVATAYALGERDAVAPMYRDLGALLVRGIGLREIFCQYMGKANSSTRGKDSGLHMHDLERGVVVNMISTLTASLPVAVGVALSFKIRREPRVAMTYLGDGATSTGSAHEGINLAAARRLPIVFVCENNQWALSTPSQKQFAVRTLIERAAGYGIPAVRVDGNDVLKVFEAARQAVADVRAGSGPRFIEAVTMRMQGHSVTDPGQYVPREMLEEWRKKDPIDRFQRFLREEQILDDPSNGEIAARVEAEIDEAVAYAEACPDPLPEELTLDVYAEAPDA